MKQCWLFKFAYLTVNQNDSHTHTHTEAQCVEEQHNLSCLFTSVFSLFLLGIASTLVYKIIERMVADECDEVVLETEVTNTAALALYENLGFIRDKYLHQYYLNGEDAYRLKLWLTDTLLE